MQQVARLNDWKNNQAQQLTSEAFVEVEYNVTDPSLPDANVGEGTDEAVYFCERIYHPNSDSTNLFASEHYDIGEDFTSYATLEKDRWKLDGSMITVPEKDYGYCGYISKSMCDQDGNFDDPVKVRIFFGGNTVNILPGLTIVWDTAHGEYAEEFTITAYRDDEGVCRSWPGQDDEIPEADNGKIVVACQMEDFKWIDIEISKWSRGNRRARIGKIFMGLNMVYGKTDLLRFSCSESIDPLSASLPKYEIQFEVDNRDHNRYHTFNPFNENGLSKSMMERQEVRTWYGFRLGDKIERIPGGVYYLSEWSAPQNGLSASFKARDLLGFLNATYYKGVFPDSEISLYDLAEQVMADEADWLRDRNSKTLWDFSGIDPTIKTLSPLPVRSVAECLQLIANAAGCSIFFDRAGKLYIAPLSDSENANELEINYDNSYTKPEISLNKPIRQVDVSLYSYSGEEGKELFKEVLTLQPGDNEFLIEYSELAKGDFEPTLTLINEGDEASIVEGKTEYYAKYCKLVINNSNIQAVNVEVVLTGTVQKSVERIVPCLNSDVIANGEVETLKNILITRIEDAENAGERLLNYLKRRKRFNVDWRVDPRIDAGDIVTIRNAPRVTAGSEDTTGTFAMRTITSSFSFNGAFKGKCEGVELAKIQYENAEADHENEEPEVEEVNE